MPRARSPHSAYGRARPSRSGVCETDSTSFPDHDGESLLARTPSVAAATGSACHSGRTEPSSVLTAMGLDAPRALTAVRLSLGYDTTAADVDTAATALVASASTTLAGR